MDEKYIATLLRKHSLANGFTLYSFVNTITGTIDEKSAIFTDDNDNEYCTYYDKALLFSEIEYAYGAPVKLSELADYLDYGEDDNEYDNTEEEELLTDENEDEVEIDELTLHDLAKIYNMDNKDIVYLIGIDSENNLTSIIINLNRDSTYEQQLTKNIIVEDPIIEKDTTYITGVNEDNEDCAISSDDIISMIIDNKFEVNELKSLRNKLIFDSESIDSTIDSIDLAIESQETGNKNGKEVKNLDITKESTIENNLKPSLDIGVFDIEGAYQNITKTVVAQDEAVKRLLVEIFRMCLDKQERNGILLTGSTGVGKTELMRNIAKYLNKPFISIDSTQLTKPGYIGKDINEYLWELYENCAGDLKKAESAIIHFDEIDKKGSSNGDDISGRAVLDVLLKFLDGTTYTASANSQRKGMTGSIKIKTDEMIVIASGAYTDVYKNIDKNPLGFNQQQETKVTNIPTSEDFVEKGMMTDEFMGRFPIIIHLNDLKVADLKRILMESTKSPIKIQEAIFKKMKVDFKVTPEYIDEIAKLAYKKKTGARSLKYAVAETTWLPLEEIGKNPFKYDSLELDKETVQDNKVYKLTKKQV